MDKTSTVVHLLTGLPIMLCSTIVATMTRLELHYNKLDSEIWLVDNVNSNS